MPKRKDQEKIRKSGGEKAASQTAGRLRRKTRGKLSVVIAGNLS